MAGSWQETLAQLEVNRLEVLAKYPEWLAIHPDFKRIADILEACNSNTLLAEYCKHAPPRSVHDKAIDIYKKCISYRIKLTKNILSPLSYHPDRSEVHRSYTKYCIDARVVKTFLTHYQEWNYKICSHWSEAYYVKEDYFNNRGYDRLGWKYYIDRPEALRIKAGRIEVLFAKIQELLKSGTELLNSLDDYITEEYTRNSFEMSLYERETEIMRVRDNASVADEEYCYVYTLACELDVFYVGIAANPQERFEQHIRGAFADEAHLFKSKFIQKYHGAIKQSIVFEGARRDCKAFERDYITKYRPLGNMTEGGEG